MKRKSYTTVTINYDLKSNYISQMRTNLPSNYSTIPSILGCVMTLSNKPTCKDYNMFGEILQNRSELVTWRAD